MEYSDVKELGGIKIATTKMNQGRKTTVNQAKKCKEMEVK